MQASGDGRLGYWRKSNECLKKSWLWRWHLPSLCNGKSMKKNQNKTKKTTLSLGEENEHRILISSDVGISIAIFASSYNLNKVFRQYKSAFYIF